MKAIVRITAPWLLSLALVPTGAQAAPTAATSNTSTPKPVAAAGSALRNAGQAEQAFAIALMRDLAANRKTYRVDMRPMYHRIKYRGLWVEPATGTLNDAGRKALVTLANSAVWGLLPNYRKMLGTFPEKPKYSAIELARAELSITNTLLRMLADLANGQLDQSDPVLNWGIQPVRVSFRRLMNMMASGQSLAEITTVISEERFGQAGLLEQLAKYEKIVEAGGWPLVLADKILKPGMVDPAIATLRRRLAIELGVDTGNNAGQKTRNGLVKVAVKNPKLYDRELGEIVRRFQANHGLKADGAIGPATQLALNLPARLRRDQILANLERLRWLPQELGEERVWVNIPDYRLQLVIDEKPQLDMGVIVGTKKRQTPVFDDLISQLEVNPTWNVPTTIAFEDYLPELRKNPLYLKKKNIRVFKNWKRGAEELDPTEVDWLGVNDRKRRWFPYRLTQDPGPNNALGTVKFLFPNSHNVYLHDTPERGLFSRLSRSFSSGCVRVEDPAALAEYFLTEQMGSPRDFEQLRSSRKTKRLFLDGSVPVYLAYFTAWVDSSGQLQFRDDIYQHDRPLLKMLADLRPETGVPPSRKRKPAKARAVLKRPKPVLTKKPQITTASAGQAVSEKSVAKQPASQAVSANNASGRSPVARPQLKTTNKQLPESTETAGAAAKVAGGGAALVGPQLPAKVLAKPKLKAAAKIESPVKAKVAPNTAAPVLVQARNKPVMASDAKAEVLPFKLNREAVEKTKPKSPATEKQRPNTAAPVLVEARSKPVMASDAKAVELPSKLKREAADKPKTKPKPSPPVVEKPRPNTVAPVLVEAMSKPAMASEAKAVALPQPMAKEAAVVSKKAKPKQLPDEPNAPAGEIVKTAEQWAAESKAKMTKAASQKAVPAAAKPKVVERVMPAKSEVKPAVEEASGASEKSAEPVPLEALNASEKPRSWRVGGRRSR